MKPNSGTPFQTRSLTSRTLLHYTASLPTQPVLEISQHCCTTKQLQYSNATTSPLQSHGLSTKESILQPELKVRFERMLETSMSDPLCTQAAITTPPAATMKQTTTYHRSKSSGIRFRTRGSRQEDTRILIIPSRISRTLFLTQVEAVSIQYSQNWIIPQATARALEVCNGSPSL